MSRILFTALGSGGDVFPMIPVATALRERGHDVTFASHHVFRPLIRREGFAYTSLGPREAPTELVSRSPHIFDSRFRGLASFLNLLKEFVLPTLGEVYSQLSERCEAADLVVTNQTQLAAPIAAEERGLPWVTFSIFPSTVASRHTLPWGQTADTFRSWRSPTATLSWHAFDRMVGKIVDGDVNRLRRSVGLLPRRYVATRGGLSRRLSIVAASPRYYPRPPDWAEHVKLSGFTYWDRPRSWKMPAGLSNFLEEGDPPILLSLGTTLSMAPGDFFRVVACALSELGLRGIAVGCTPETLAGIREREVIKPVAYAPLSELLPHCQAIVHHGGFGSTSAALHAGRPAVAVPRMFDQYVNARRCERLGVASSIPWRKMTCAQLTKKLEAALQPSMAVNCNNFAREVRGENGTASAADAIEAVLGRRP